MILRSDIRRAEYIIDTSGIVDILEDGVRRSPRGRKAKTDALRLLLLGMYLSVHHGGSAAITDIHATLTVKLPLDEQFRLGIRQHTGSTTSTVSYRNLEYQANRINTNLAYGHGSQPHLDDTERIRRHTTVTTALNALMDVFDLGWSSSTIALDATGIWSWGKGFRRTAAVTIDDDTNLEEELASLLQQARETGVIPDQLVRIVNALRDREAREAKIATSQTAISDAEDDTEQPQPLIPTGKGKSHDPDASWGIKTSKSGKSEVFFGDHEHTLVLADGSTDNRTEPPLIRRLELTPATSSSSSSTSTTATRSPTGGCCASSNAASVRPTTSAPTNRASSSTSRCASQPAAPTARPPPTRSGSSPNPDHSRPRRSSSTSTVKSNNATPTPCASSTSSAPTERSATNAPP